MMSSAIIILLFTGLSAAMAETEPLAISVMLPLSFPHLDGDAYLPAMDIALELINNKSDLLPGYTLNAIVNDSAVSIKFEYVTCIMHNINFLKHNELYCA